MIDTISAEHIIADRYRLLEEVGQGGMATVFRGQDLLLEREIAIKILHPHLARDSEHRQRFRREARTIARLHHTNIVEIYDFSDQDSHSERSSPSPPIYLIMEFIDGQNLQSFLDQQEFPLCELAAAMVAVIAEALQHAHQQNIIHRDLKPENVLLCKQGDIKLTDFGLSKILDHEGMTRTGSILGSPAYMAPEQLEGRLGDHRADIFALGIILYRLTCKQHPFMRSNPAATLQAISKVDCPDPERIQPGMGRQLAQIIRRSLAEQPEQRYPTTSAMLEDLQTYLHEVGIHHPKDTLAAFFRNPEAEETRLRQQILLQLKQRAYTLAANKKLSMALDRCNRALALEPHDPDIDKLVERLSQSERWYHKPAVWLVLCLAIGVSASMFWYIPMLWELWSQESARTNPRVPVMVGNHTGFKRPTSEIPRISPPIPSPRLKMSAKQFVSTQLRSTPQHRETAVSVQPPRRELLPKQKRRRTVSLGSTWRPVILGEHRFALRYQPQGQWLHVRGLQRVQIQINQQTTNLSSKPLHRVALRGASPYRMILTDQRGRRVLWLLPPISPRPTVRVVRRVVEPPTPPAKPPYLIDIDGEKDVISRNIIIHIAPFSSIQASSGPLKKRGTATQASHILSLRSNRIWTIHASHPYAYTRIWRIRVPNTNVPEEQEISHDGKPLKDWQPLTASPDAAGFALRNVMTFKSVFFYLQCNVPDATLILNGQIRGPLSIRKQTFNVPWTWNSVTAQVAIEVSHDLYLDWQRVVLVKPGQHVSLSIQLKPRTATKPSPSPAPRPLQLPRNQR